MIDRRFRAKHDIAWAWHIGIFFCIEPRNSIGQRNIYLLFCFGHHDLSIGMITGYDEGER